MGRPSKHSPEVRERAVRMVFDHTPEPIGSHMTQPDPEQWISGGQLRSLHQTLKYTNLVTKGEILELQSRAGRGNDSASDLKNAVRTAAGANRRRDNPQCITQFRLSGNHRHVNEQSGHTAPDPPLAVSRVVRSQPSSACQLSALYAIMGRTGGPRWLTTRSCRTATPPTAS
jgi:hypothetical protein